MRTAQQLDSYTKEPILKRLMKYKKYNGEIYMRVLNKNMIIATLGILLASSTVNAQVSLRSVTNKGLATACPLGTICPPSSTPQLCSLEAADVMDALLSTPEGFDLTVINAYQNLVTQKTADLEACMANQPLTLMADGGGSGDGSTTRSDGNTSMKSGSTIPGTQADFLKALVDHGNLIGSPSSTNSVEPAEVSEGGSFILADF